MRTQTEMLACIRAFIDNQSDIQVAYLNGSRANPKAPEDMYQDYDLVLVVPTLTPYLNDNAWLSELGSVAFIQEPDAALKHNHSVHCYGFLTLFDDHNRIDLTLETMEHFNSKVHDSMTHVLFDPHGLCKNLPPMSDQDYWVKKPSESQFLETVNNFWWCLNNVGKGIRRDEMPYVMHMFHSECIGALDCMIAWDIASQHDYRVNVGKHGKWFKMFMEPELYAHYLSSYTSTEYSEMINAIEISMDLMHLLGTRVADRLNYTYHQHEEDAMRSYMQWVLKP